MRAFLFWSALFAFLEVIILSDIVDTTAPKKRTVKAPKQEQQAAEVIVQIPLSKLHAFPNHPFSVNDDELMEQTVKSIKANGVLIPGIARPRQDGEYEIVAGHRRKRACELAERETLPCVIRNLDDDAAIIIMVDSNIQRENTPPSERAKAYKMKLEAIKRQAGRPSKENAPNNSANFRSDDEIGEKMGISGDTVRNYISLTQLEPELMQMVDDGKISLTPAYQIAALKPEEQQMLLTAINSEQVTPSVSQAQRMKRLSQEGKLDDDAMLGIMSEQKKPEKRDVTLSGDKLAKYFPRSYTPQRIEETILKLLDAWMKKRQRDQER